MQVWKFYGADPLLTGASFFTILSVFGANSVVPLFMWAVSPAPLDNWGVGRLVIGIWILGMLGNAAWRWVIIPRWIKSFGWFSKWVWTPLIIGGLVTLAYYLLAQNTLLQFLPIYLSRPSYALGYFAVTTAISILILGLLHMGSHLWYKSDSKLEKRGVLA